RHTRSAEAGLGELRGWRSPNTERHQPHDRSVPDRPARLPARGLPGAVLAGRRRRRRARARGRVSWLLQPAPIAAIVTLALYALGTRRRLRLVGAARPEWRWRGACFLAGVASIVFVLGPTFDHWADELLWAHMLQHVVLMSFAPPLIVLGAPWLPVWRGLPLGLRRPLARFAVGLPRIVRAGFRSLRDPYV